MIYVNQIIMLLAAAAKSLQSCLTLCDPIDGSPLGSPVPGILQARTLEWVAISFSNAWKEKWKWSHSVLSNSSRPHGLPPTRILCPWDFPGKSTGVGCHCLLRIILYLIPYIYTVLCVNYILINLEGKKIKNSLYHIRRCNAWSCSHPTPLFVRSRISGSWRRSMYLTGKYQHKFSWLQNTKCYV